jgi:hypothetical protein
MKIVTLTRDMRPWRAGDRPVVPDVLAEALITAGDAKDPQSFPPADVAGPEIRPPKGRYLTRKAGAR